MWRIVTLGSFLTNVETDFVVTLNTPTGVGVFRAPVETGQSRTIVPVVS